MICPRSYMQQWRSTKRLEKINFIIIIFLPEYHFFCSKFGKCWQEPLLRPKIQVFFVIHLHAGPVINTLPPIMDPDPMLTCDLMDGRDAFLTLARDKHWEFSSLRRCKWSSMCMLVELHNQGQDRFVYTCNECKHHVETRWHCTVCEVSLLFVALTAV